MKKLLLLLCAILSTVGGVSWAQTNLTLGKTVSPLGGLVQTSAYTEKTDAVTAVSEENLQNLTKDDDNLAILLPQPTGNWSSIDKASEQPVQGFFIDLGESKTVGSLSVQWETVDVSAKNFKIYLSTTAPSSESSGQDVTIPTDAVEILSIENNNQQTNTKTYAESEQKSGRYVIFKADKGANQVWGIKMRRFFVYDNETPTLTSLILTPSKFYTTVGTAYDLTLAGLDKIFSSFDISDKTPTYTVSPTDAGSVSDGKFTASLTGEITITAKIDDVTSNTVTVYGVSSDNLITAINQFIDMSTGVPEAVAGLYDGNEESPDWVVLSSSTEGGTCDVSFTVDLKDKYDVDMVAVAFEGARAGAYTISFSENNTTWREAYSVAARTGVEASKDRFTETTADKSNVRYVKFHFTTAATGYGIKIREVSVFGTESTAPTAISLSTSATEVVAGKQVTLTVKKENDRVISPSLVTFTSSNTAIATVDAEGVVTAVEAGNVTITATLKSDNLISNTIDLTVNPKPEGLELTNGTHSIIVQTIKYTGSENYYEMIIYSDEEIDDIHNSYWKLNGSSEGSNITPYSVSTDKYILTISNVNSTADPVFTTPIYLKMAGEAEITFGTAETLNSNIDWVLIQKGEIGEAVTVNSVTSEEISEGTNSGKKIEYTWEFTQTGSNQVTLKFKCKNEADITGLVYPETLTEATTGAVKTGEGEWTWYGQKRGKTLTGKCYWAFEGGGYTTDAVTYTVRDPLTISETTGTATITGELRPANVGDINKLTAENNKIDLTGVTIKQAAAVVPANNPNAVVIATEAQKTNLAGTKNLVISSGENYTADAITYTDKPGTVPADLAIKTATATYTRTCISADKLFSVALPFDFTITDDFKAYIVNEYDETNKKITFTGVTGTSTLSKDKAYVIKNVSGVEKDFVATKATAATDAFDFTETETTGTGYATKPNLKQNLDATGDKYVLSGNVIKKLAGTAGVAAFRGYFTFTSSPLSHELSIDLGSDVTGINQIENIENVLSGKFYNLQGQEVKNPTKGIYIVNGKKVVIK